MLNYLTNLQGTTYLYAFASKVENNIHPDQLASGPGKCLGILSSAVFSKLIYYIDYHIDHHQSQTVWIQIRSDILSVLIWLKLFAKVISRQQLQAKSNFSSVYLTNLQGTVSAMFTAVALGPVMSPWALLSVKLTVPEQTLKALYHLFVCIYKQSRKQYTS